MLQTRFPLGSACPATLIVDIDQLVHSFARVCTRMVIGITCIVPHITPASVFAGPRIRPPVRLVHDFLFEGRPAL